MRMFIPPQAWLQDQTDDQPPCRPILGLCCPLPLAVAQSPISLMATKRRSQGRLFVVALLDEFIERLRVGKA